jgi:hypothetical protein
MAWSWYAMTGAISSLRNALVASTKSTVGVAFRTDDNARPGEPLLISVGDGPISLVLASSRAGIEKILNISNQVTITPRSMEEALQIARRNGADSAFLFGELSATVILPINLLQELVCGAELIQDGDSLCMSILSPAEWTKEISESLPTWVRIWILDHLDQVADLDRAWLMTRMGEHGDQGSELVLDFAWDIPDEVRMDRAILLSRLLIHSGAMKEIPDW